MTNQIIRECDGCGNEDGINLVTGLCVGCCDSEPDKPDYEAGYNILIDYFDSIPDEDKEEVDKKLRGAGL